MRFDKRVDIFKLQPMDDGQGGHTNLEIVVGTNIKANVLEKPLEYIAKVYGNTMIKVIDVVLLTKYERLDKVRYNGQIFEVQRFHTRGNKTYIVAEETNE